MSKEFGSRVRQARKNAGMTQAELAEKKNLDTTTISRIENGNLSTSFSSMLNFSKVLNVRFEYLICDYLEEKPSISDPLELEILDLLRPLPEHYKRYIRDNIQSLIREFPATPDSEDKT